MNDMDRNQRTNRTAIAAANSSAAPPTITAPAHCRRVNGPIRSGSGAAMGALFARRSAFQRTPAAPGNTVRGEGSGSSAAEGSATVTATAASLVAAAGVVPGRGRPVRRDAGEAVDAAPTGSDVPAAGEGSPAAGETVDAASSTGAGAKSAEGQGSPPFTWGRPRRTAMPVDAATAAVGAAEVAARVDAPLGASWRSLSEGAPEPEPAPPEAPAAPTEAPATSGVGVGTTETRRVDGSADASATARAGGHGSPPLTRGRPRRRETFPELVGESSAGDAAAPRSSVPICLVEPPAATVSAGPA